jgi:hypothetical protein
MLGNDPYYGASSNTTLCVYPGCPKNNFHLIELACVELPEDEQKFPERDVSVFVLVNLLKKRKTIIKVHSHR